MTPRTFGMRKRHYLKFKINAAHYFFFVVRGGCRPMLVGTLCSQLAFSLLLRADFALSSVSFDLYLELES